MKSIDTLAVDRPVITYHTHPREINSYGLVGTVTHGMEKAYILKVINTDQYMVLDHKHAMDTVFKK